MRCVSDLMEERYFLSSPYSRCVLGIPFHFWKSGISRKGCFSGAGNNPAELRPVRYSGPFILQKTCCAKRLEGLMPASVPSCLFLRCAKMKSVPCSKTAFHAARDFHLDLRAEHVRSAGFPPTRWMKNDFIMQCSLSRFLTRKNSSDLLCEAFFALRALLPLILPF